MKWQAAEEDYKESFKKFGKKAFVYQFHDTREAMGSTGSKRVFTQSRPSDFLITHDGVTFYAEVKSCATPTSFSFSNIRPDQWMYATLTAAAKGLYFFILKSEALDKWYKVPAPFLISLKDDNIKSVKWENLNAYEFNI